eukprot:comp12377_c1_seq1/m.7271 comp12377_c1_seq1/g.7271  ORF comp12377_c1_seq1/g.7271 comp12377_c1_seq1/m.7271 type:complete len:423 (+) comp12377_c1_seq1:297-1565(+)
MFAAHRGILWQRHKGVFEGGDLVGARCLLGALELNLQSLVAHLVAIHVLDCVVGRGSVVIADEPEAFALVGVLVNKDLCANNGAERRKGLEEIVVTPLQGQMVDEEVGPLGTSGCGWLLGCGGKGSCAKGWLAVGKGTRSKALLHGGHCLLLHAELGHVLAQSPHAGSGGHAHAHAHLAVALAHLLRHHLLLLQHLLVHHGVGEHVVDGGKVCRGSAAHLLGALLLLLLLGLCRLDHDGLGTAVHGDAVVQRLDSRLGLAERGIAHKRTAFALAAGVLQDGEVLNGAVRTEHGPKLLLSGRLSNHANEQLALLFLLRLAVGKLNLQGMVHPRECTLAVQILHTLIGTDAVTIRDERTPLACACQLVPQNVKLKHRPKLLKNCHQFALAMATGNLPNEELNCVRVLSLNLNCGAGHFSRISSP